MVYLKDIDLSIRDLSSTGSDVQIGLLDPAFRPQLALVKLLASSPKEY